MIHKEFYNLSCSVSSTIYDDEYIISRKSICYLLNAALFAMVFWDQLGNNEWFDDLYVTYVYNVWNILPMQCNATVFDPLKAVPLCAVTIMVSAT